MGEHGDPFLRVSERQLKVIGECLRAATDGPFFSDEEFGTLIGGMTRAEVVAVGLRWPDRANPRPQDIAVNDVLNNLLSYPHGQWKSWSSFISVEPDEVGRILASWRGDDEFDARARGYFDRLA